MNCGPAGADGEFALTDGHWLLSILIERIMPIVASTTDLRKLVRETLCELNGLAAEAFEMSERELMRAGKRCGLLFCIRGPRSVQLTAVWDQERHVVLFYGSAGERLQSMQLKSSVVAG